MRKHINAGYGAILLAINFGGMALWEQWLSVFLESDFILKIPLAK